MSTMKKSSKDAQISKSPSTLLPKPGNRIVPAKVILFGDGYAITKIYVKRIRI